MIILTAVENSYGLLFNHRRVSRDRVLREKILGIAEGSVLWMDAFSAKQFTQGLPENVKVSETFLDEAKNGDFAFVEDHALLPYTDKIESLYLFKWNRDYPSDFKLDFLPDKQGFHLSAIEDFAGFSHDDITMEVWEREGKETFEILKKEHSCD